VTAEPIQHFLVVYDISRGRPTITSFGTDLDAALKAYAEAERAHRDDRDVEVVLLGSDSIEGLERTHGSWFGLADRHADRVVARELAAHGLG
jgi:hypothetical protein